MDSKTAIPLEAFFDTSGVSPNVSERFDARQKLADAEVIIAVDVMTRDQSIAFGKVTLERIASGSTTQEVSVLRIEIDQDSDELEKLAALLITTKGSCDL